MTLQLRPWQADAQLKALEWLVRDRVDRHFLINAAPGAGKTLASCAIADALLKLGEIDRVVVIAPRTSVVNQWADDFKFVTGRFMTKVTGRDEDIEGMDLDVCATWAAVQGLMPQLQAVCRSSKVLLICDEHHHAAVEAAWGQGADGAFEAAKFVLVLTGTPIRSDGGRSVWLAYDDAGAIDHPDGGSYTLTYGKAVDLNYCRPVTFHRHSGKFTVDLEGGVAVEVADHKQPDLPKEFARIPGLQAALDFYKLARTPQFEADGKTPKSDGYQATMLEWAIQKLYDLRERMPNAGGLVIAPSIDMAQYICDLLEKLDGEKPVLVHSQMPNADGKIDTFRNTDKRWLVSVAMVSEGVDIKRLRVLMYLPNATTELAFRQAIGRVVRTAGPHDDTRAYVVMPALQIFEEYARRVEEEMPAGKRKDETPNTKRCPICGTECQRGDSECAACGHEFPKAPPRLRPCPDCGTLNPVTATSCLACGKSLTQSFTLTLNEALRIGAIIRGMDVEETEVVEGERIAKDVREAVLRSGDANLVKVMQALPEESWGRLKDLLNKA